jgi:hypothetical protein
LSSAGQRPAPPTHVTAQRHPNLPILLSHSRQLTLILIVQDLERVVIHQTHFSLLVSS